MQSVSAERLRSIIASAPDTKALISLLRAHKIPLRSVPGCAQQELSVLCKTGIFLIYRASPRSPFLCRLSPVSVPVPAPVPAPAPVPVPESKGGLKNV